jgi:hypothetical protein
VYDANAKTLKNAFSNKCLDIRGNDGSDGAWLIQYSCHGESNQQWTFPSLGSDGSGE